MATESFHDLKKKIVEIFGKNPSIAISDMESIVKALSALESKLSPVSHGDTAPSMEEIDLMMYGSQKAEKGGATEEMCKDLAASRAVSAARIDWACAYGKVEKAKDELDYLESRERTLRYAVDSSPPLPKRVILSRRAFF
jgi:hypothetical protein